MLALLPFVVAGCGLTRIVTVSPDVADYHTYTTTVTVPRARTMTSTTRVIAADRDISLCLDLQAVAAIFAQSSTVEEFEDLLNNSSYMISNLDLNGDGYVDYLRVLETVEGYNHVFLIQAVLDHNVYQDVATLIAEVPGISTARVQIIGAPYIYGPAYIIQPVYHVTPLIFAHLIVPAYRPWLSPWHWNHFPPHYKHPAPIFVSHYQAYVVTFMSNHRYCHKVEYAPVCHYPDYDRVSRPNQRNDYGQQHPERSFTERTANMPINRSASATNRAANARDIRELQESTSVVNSVPATSSRAQSSTTSSRSASASRTQSASGTTRPAETSQRAQSASGSSRAATTATRPAAGNQPSSSAVSRSTTGNQPSSSAASRSTTGNQSSGAAATSRSSAVHNTRSAGQTTVQTRVNKSGTSNTKISTVSPSGEKSTVKRTGGSSGRSASSNGSATRR